MSLPPPPPTAFAGNAPRGGSMARNGSPSRNASIQWGSGINALGSMISNPSGWGSRMPMQTHMPNAGEPFLGVGAASRQNSLLPMPGSPHHASQSGTMGSGHVPSGLPGRDFQIQIAKLLDVPSVHPANGQPTSYIVKALDSAGTPLAASGEIRNKDRDSGRMTREERARISDTIVVSGPEGFLRLRTEALTVFLQVDHAKGGTIGRCRIHRQDRRSNRFWSYSLDMQGQPVHCGIELRVIEGREGYDSQPVHAFQTSIDDPRVTSLGRDRPSRMEPLPHSLAIVPDAHPAAQSAAPVPLEYEISPEHGPYPSLEGRQQLPSYGRGPPGAGVRAMPGSIAGPANSGINGLRITRLMDMPRRYRDGGVPLAYVIKVKDGNSEIARTRKVENSSTPKGADVETVSLGAEGKLEFHTEAKLIYVEVEYADGVLLGRCHIHRLDPRSLTVSPYALSDQQQKPVNCGIELQVLERPGTRVGGSVGSAYVGGSAYGGGAQENVAMGHLHVVVVAGHNLRNKDWGVFGDVSDPFVVVRVGRNERKTLPIANCLNPVWKRDNQFTLPVGPEDGMLEVDVINSNMFKNDSLGTTTIGLWSIEPDKWTRLKERLVGGKGGEIELDVRFEPNRQMLEQARVTPGPVHNLPPHVIPALADAQTAQLTADDPHSLYSRHPVPHQGRVALDPALDPRFRDPKVADPSLTPGALLPYFGQDADWEASELPRAFFSVDFIEEEPPDPHAEFWAQKPPASSIDDLFGLDMDDEVDAAFAEPWRAPVLAQHDPIFQDNVFPDMDMRILLHPKGEDVKPAQKDTAHLNKRKKDKLPEFNMNGWDDANKLKPHQKALAAPPTVGGRPAASAGKATADKEAAVEKASLVKSRKRGKLKVERELVRPELQRDIERQLSFPDLLQLDPALQPENFEFQALGGIDAHEEPGLEKRVWLRDRQKIIRPPEKDDGNRSWLEEFQTEELRIGLSCRRGRRGDSDPIPNQDNFSLTKIDSETSFFAVCDGHGPFGHLASFRVAQSLPKFLIDKMQSSSSKMRPEHALAQAFEDACEDLIHFAVDYDLNLAISGTSCVALLRIGSSVQFAWLGDSRVLVGIIPSEGTNKRVDMLSTPHICENAAEGKRVRDCKAELRSVPAGDAGHLRLFAPGERVPCIRVTRALGDLAGKDYGVIAKPDLKKTSFAKTPGLVLLGSGGFWDAHVDDPNDPCQKAGDKVLGLLASDCGLWKRGALQAARRLGTETQDLWSDATEGHRCDTTCLLLHWTRPSGPGQTLPGQSQAQTQSQPQQSQPQSQQQQPQPQQPQPQSQPHLEQSPQPQSRLGRSQLARLVASASRGTNVLELSSYEGFRIGQAVCINPGSSTEELRRISAFGSMILSEHLQHNHYAGEVVVPAEGDTKQQRVAQQPVAGPEAQATPETSYLASPARAAAVGRGSDSPSSSMRPESPPRRPESPPPSPPKSHFMASTEEYLAWRAQQTPKEPAHTTTLGAASQAVARAAQGTFRATQLKPIVLARPLSETEDAALIRKHCSNPALAHPDFDLLPVSFSARVLGVIAAGKPLSSAEPEAWYLSPGIQPAKMTTRSATERFVGLEGRARVAVQCRRGYSKGGTDATPCGDNFSMTLASGGRAVYVVCDGHGPLGHLVAFRVAQSLPKYILDDLGRGEPTLGEGDKDKEVITKAFDAAADDLARLARAEALDLESSGTSVVAAIRQGDRVQVAWLGDSRALVATVVEESRCRVDLMARPHLPSEPAELQRLQKGGLDVRRSSAGAAVRIFAPGEELPGLSVSRAIGNSSVSDRGVTPQPDLARTSFADMPGLVLLASGGLCEYIEEDASPTEGGGNEGGAGDAALDGLVLHGGILQQGPWHALGRLCDSVQERWRREEDGYCDDVTGLLLHWPPEEDVAGLRTGQLPVSASRYQPRGAPVEQRQTVAAAVAAASAFAEQCRLADAARPRTPSPPVGQQAARSACAQPGPSPQRFLQAQPSWSRAAPGQVQQGSSIPRVVQAKPPSSQPQSLAAFAASQPPLTRQMQSQAPTTAVQGPQPPQSFLQASPAAPSSSAPSAAPVTDASVAGARPTTAGSLARRMAAAAPNLPTVPE